MGVWADGIDRTKNRNKTLGKHPHVARFYPAPQQEGGAGTTIVELRE